MSRPIQLLNETGGTRGAACPIPAGPIRTHKVCRARPIKAPDPLRLLGGAAHQPRLANNLAAKHTAAWKLLAVPLRSALAAHGCLEGPRVQVPLSRWRRFHAGDD